MRQTVTMAAEARELYRQVLLNEDLTRCGSSTPRVVTEQLLNVASWLGIDSLLGAGDVPDAAGAPSGRA